MSESARDVRRFVSSLQGLSVSGIREAFFTWYFAYYQEEDVDLAKRPDLHGLVTDWLPPKELVRQLKVGDLVEFKGTRTGVQLFHHWSICVKVNGTVVCSQRTTQHVRLLHLGRIARQSLGWAEIANYGLVFVSAKVRMETVGETQITRFGRINNSLDLKWAPFEAKDIAHFALTWAEMVVALVNTVFVLAALVSTIALPAWLTLYTAFLLVIGFIYGLQAWRAYEHALYVHQRQRDMPMSYFNLADVITHFTLYEAFLVFCSWLTLLGLRCIVFFFYFQMMDTKLFADFGIKSVDNFRARA